MEIEITRLETTEAAVSALNFEVSGVLRDYPKKGILKGMLYQSEWDIQTRCTLAKHHQKNLQMLLLEIRKDLSRACRIGEGIYAKAIKADVEAQ